MLRGSNLQQTPHLGSASLIGSLVMEVNKAVSLSMQATFGVTGT